MMRFMRLLLVVASHFPLMAGALSIDTPKSSNPLSSTILSRRDVAIGGAALIFGLSTLPNMAVAETDLSMYSDLSDGIKFLITKEGEGEKPLRVQQVYTKYSLWTGGFPEDGGKLIDSNAGFWGGQPLTVIVGVGKVIKGWDLALLDMKVGENRRLVVPSEAGYGSQGAPPRILPNATLFFVSTTVGAVTLVADGIWASNALSLILLNHRKWKSLVWARSRT
jgi:hypothetical protein